MKFKIRKVISILLVLCILVTFSFMSMITVLAAQVIEASDETTLTAALNSAQTGDTIKLMANFNYSKSIIISGKSISFDLNGHILNGMGLKVEDGGLTLAGSNGEFNVSGIDYGVAALSGGVTTVTNAISTGYGGKGVYACKGGTITVRGNATATNESSIGAMAENGGKVTINGNAQGVFCGADTYGLDSIVTITGDATGTGPDGFGAYCGNSTITIGGNATATDTSGTGAIVDSGGQITIHGNVQGGNNGACTYNGTGSIVVDGDATTTGDGSIAAYAYGGTITIGGNVVGGGVDSVGAASDNGGKITIDGDTRGGRKGASSIGLGSIITVEGNAIATEDNSAGTTTDNGGSITIAGNVQGIWCGVFANGAGSSVIVGGDSMGGTDDYKYTDNSNTVWVKDNSHVDYVCEISGSSQYATLDEALAVVGDTQTIRLLKNIPNHTNSIIISAKHINLDLNGYTLDVNVTTGTGLEVTNAGSIGLTGSGGEFNVTGSNYGVYVDNATANVTNTRGTSVGSSGAYATNGGFIEIDNNVVGEQYGAYAITGGAITVNGEVSANIYLKVGETERGENDYEEVTTLQGYHTFTDGVSNVWVRSTSTPPITNNPPTWPVNSTLTASNTTTTGTILSWTAAIDDAGVTDYRIYQDNVLIQTVIGEINSYQVTGLSSSTTYSFKVQSGDAEDKWTDGPSINVLTNSSVANIGGSSKSYSPPPKELPLAYVLDSDWKVIESITPKLDNNTGVATVEVDSTSLSNALSKSKANDKGVKVVRVHIPKIDGAFTYEPTLPVRFLPAGDESWAVEIKTHIGDVTLTSGMLAEAATVGAIRVSLKISAGNKSKLGAEVQAQISERPIIQLSMKLDGKQTAWSNKSASVIVSVPYTPPPGELLETEHITVWYIDDSGKTIAVPNGRYISATGRVNFYITHFGKYSIVYVQRTFSDIDRYAWAKNSIEVLASKGIINGISIENFSPSENITRADYLVFLTKILELSADFESNFDDVEPGSYYYDAVGIAKELGIVEGNGKNYFNPNENISRQDMIVITTKALKKLKKLETTESFIVLDKFIDKGDISGYAVESLANMVKEGLLVGTGGKLNPRAQTTRAEAAVFLYKIYNKY